MARTTKNPQVGNRTQRAKIAARPDPYWHLIAEGQHLGYRKTGERQGSWVARFRDPETKQRRWEALGQADDTVDANGDSVLSFGQAIEAAQAWIKRTAQAASAGEVARGKYSIRELMADYLAEQERKTRKPQTKLKSVIGTHILPTLGSMDVNKLTHGKLKAWRDGIAEAAPRVRTKEAGATAFRVMDGGNPDTMRKRQATANRIFAVLRAALNYGHSELHRIGTKGAWERLKPFREVDVPRMRYLSVDEAKRLISACPGDFRDVVRAALYTGCRYGELAALTVANYNPDSRTLHVERSKSGKDRHIPLTQEGAAFFASVADDRKGSELLLTHADGRRKNEAWEATQQRYWMALACTAAEIEPAISFHILRHTYASQLAMNGTPMPVIAALLGHADTRMTEKHYGHLAPSYIADTLRANLPSFGFEASKPGPKLVQSAS